MGVSGASLGQERRVTQTIEMVEEALEGSQMAKERGDA